MGIAIGLGVIPGVPRGAVGGLRSRIWPKELGRGSRPDLAEVKTSPMQAVSVATALIGRGLQSDRYVAKVGAFSPRSEKFRHHNLTLIKDKALDASTLPDGSHLPPEEARRNILTRGIDLNALVDRKFRIGSVRAFEQRLCEPCVHL